MDHFRSWAVMSSGIALSVALAWPVGASAQTRAPSSLAASRAGSRPVAQGVAPAAVTRAWSPAGSKTIGPDNEMSMTALRSVVSRRQTDVGQVTDVMGGNGMRQAVDTINGSGGQAPCRNACAKARRANR